MPKIPLFFWNHAVDTLSSLSCSVMGLFFLIHKRFLYTKKMGCSSLYHQYFFQFTVFLLWSGISRRFYFCKLIHFPMFLYPVIVRENFLTQKFIINCPMMSSPPWPSHPCFAFSSWDPAWVEGGPREGTRSFQPDGQGLGRQATERKWDVALWVVRTSCAHTNSYRKTCSCVPLEFLRKETKALRSTLRPTAAHRLRDQACGPTVRVGMRSQYGVRHRWRPCVKLPFFTRCIFPTPCRIFC